MHRVIVKKPCEFAEFRDASRRLLAAGIAPDAVEWLLPGETMPGWGESLPDVADALPANGTSTASARVPAQFLVLCRAVLLHRAAGRHALLYRLLWRLTFEPALRHDPLDSQMMAAQAKAQSVRRDIHKMRAFVRFTRLVDGRHVAWFEPDHFIVEANADFFQRRFAAMHWAIFTPDRSMEWNGAELILGPGGDRSLRPPPDAGEALWLTYYESIFNPARLKIDMMVKEMPRRYWPNLPEAALIGRLTQQASARTDDMLAAPAGTGRRFRRMESVRPAIVLRARPEKLDDVRAATLACDACPIGRAATQAVCGEGPVRAACMLVGEQPGDVEDLAGRPFVGPAGQLLDRALAALDWPRESIYLTNAVKHFKYELRGKRRMHKTAAQREAEACGQWLEHEIRLVAPSKLVALGATAARSLLGRAVAVERESGQWFLERDDGRPVLVTRHPAALLRLPQEAQEEAWKLWLSHLAMARDA